MMHPVGTTGRPSRKMASGEYAGELDRTGWKLMLIRRCAYMRLPPSKRETLLTKWKLVFQQFKENRHG